MRHGISDMERSSRGIEGRSWEWGSFCYHPPHYTRTSTPRKSTMTPSGLDAKATSLMWYYVVNSIPVGQASGTAIGISILLSIVGPLLAAALFVRSLSFYKKGDRRKRRALKGCGMTCFAIGMSVRVWMSRTSSCLTSFIDSRAMDTTDVD